MPATPAWPPKSAPRLFVPGPLAVDQALSLDGPQAHYLLRVMRAAGQAPVGHVANAVMLHARLRPGLRLLEILALTRSLGEKLGDDPERYAWRDAGGDRVTLDLESGRLVRWQLDRARAEREGDTGTGV